jgi:hypothetical protein
VAACAERPPRVAAAVLAQSAWVAEVVSEVVAVFEIVAVVVDAATTHATVDAVVALDA